MKIVANTFFLRNLKNLSYFTVNLGKSRKLINDDQNRFRKLDEFQVKYQNLYNGTLMEFGNIANKVKFYEDVKLKDKKIIIFNKEDIYEINWTDDDINDIGDFILETMRKITEAENQEQLIDNNNQKMIEKYADDNDQNLWVAKDDKNYGKKYLIDQTLSKEEYRKEMQKMLKK